MEQLISFIGLSFDLSMVSSLADVYNQWLSLNGEAALFTSLLLTFALILVGGLFNDEVIPVVALVGIIGFLTISLFMFAFGDTYSMKFLYSENDGNHINIINEETGEYNRSFKFSSVEDLKKADITLHFEHQLSIYITNKPRTGDFIKLTSSQLTLGEYLYVYLRVSENSLNPTSKGVWLEFSSGEDDSIKISNSCLYKMENEIEDINCLERRKMYLRYLSGDSRDQNELTTMEIDYLDSKLLKSILKE